MIFFRKKYVFSFCSEKELDFQVFKYHTPMYLISHEEKRIPLAGKCKNRKYVFWLKKHENEFF